MKPITFVTFKWTPPGVYRSTFLGAHVDILRRMVRRNYPHPHRFVLVTDDATGVTEPDIEIYRLWDDLGDIPSPHGHNNPSCYRRLRLFAKNPGAFLGERFISLDLDCVITGDLTDIVQRDEDFIIWRSCTNGNPYNGSMFMLQAGARPQVWRDFDPVLSPRRTKAAGIFGSDQAWIAYSLGPNEAVWDKSDGVYSFRLDLRPNGVGLPDNAKVVFFHGNYDPWDREVRRKYPWVAEHYR